MDDKEFYKHVISLIDTSARRGALDGKELKLVAEIRDYAFNKLQPPVKKVSDKLIEDKKESKDG